MNRHKVLFQCIVILTLAVGFSLGFVVKAALAGKPTCTSCSQSNEYYELDSEQIGSDFDFQPTTTNEDIDDTTHNGGGHALMGW